jgi:ABC-type glycerol-3-phosphate transport system substrate-binding protein
MQPIADAYEEKMQGAVKIEIVQVEPADLFPNIINEAISQIGLYDGFITSPIVTGSVVQYDGFADLTPFIQETAERAASWADVLLGYRKWVAQYQEKIIMFPLDGDMFSLFYRRDVLEEFKLPVPRTWDEYAATAEAVHGKVFQGNVLQGSCIGRTPNCAGVYWANLVIASMTQTEGAWQGHLFDTADMLPLTGPVLEETLRLMELQAKYGSPDGTFLLL